MWEIRNLDLFEARTTSLSSVDVEVFSAALQRRSLGGLVDLKERAWRLVYLADGGVVIATELEEQAFRGPALIWHPWQAGHRLRANAGSSGATALLSEAMLANAIGHKPESADLRLLVASGFALNLEHARSIERDVGRAFEVIQREFLAAEPGAGTVIEAEIRVLLVLIWRHMAAPKELSLISAGSAQALSAFRQLVELHFRDRWKIARYAAELGMTRDRLHDICQRTLGKSPLRLVHERSAAEAEALLLRSTQTLDQIAGHLGFRSTPHFSRFFRSMFGDPPGTYRKNSGSMTDSTHPQSKRSFADWP